MKTNSKDTTVLKELSIIIFRAYLISLDFSFNKHPHNRIMVYLLLYKEKVSGYYS